MFLPFTQGQQTCQENLMVPFSFKDPSLLIGPQQVSMITYLQSFRGVSITLHHQSILDINLHIFLILLKNLEHCHIYFICNLQVTSNENYAHSQGKGNQQKIAC